MRKSSILACGCLALLQAVVRADPVPMDASWAGHDGLVLDVSFSPVGKRLATVADDGKLRLWDVATHKMVGEIAGLNENENQARFTPDGRTVYALDRGGSLARLDADGHALKPLDAGPASGSVKAFDLSPDGKTVALAGRGSLRVLSTADASERANWVVDENYGLAAVAFSPDGRSVAVASTAHKATVLDPGTGKIAWTMDLPLNGVAVAFARDGKTLFVASSDATVQAFDLATGAGKTLSDGKVAVRNLAPSPDGKSLYLGGTGSKPWRVRLPGGELDEAPLASDAWNKAVAVSPDGRHVAGGTNDGRIELWTAPSN